MILTLKVRYVALFIPVLLISASVAGAQKPAADQQAVAEFYKDKNIRMVVGYPPGGGFDFYSRLVARHMGRHTPGNPRFIVQNMPGAGGLIAPRVVYSVEPKDGTVIVTTNQFFVLQQALGRPGIEFDHRKFNWLGSAHKPIGHCAVRQDLGVRGIEDIIGGKELHTATSRPGSSGYDIPAVLNAALGTRFKLVTGYPGIAPVLAAIDRKEADAFCSADPLHPAMTPALGGENPVAKVVVTLLPHPSDHPLLSDAPSAENLAKTPEAKMLLRTLAAPLKMAFPWAVAPEVPSERVAALRQALARTFTDSRFLSEAKKAQTGLDFTAGDEVSQTVHDILNTPQATLDKLKEILK